jgi:hypothetical protein
MRSEAPMAAPRGSCDRAPVNGETARGGRQSPCSGAALVTESMDRLAVPTPSRCGAMLAPDTTMRDDRQVGTGALAVHAPALVLGP